MGRPKVNICFTFAMQQLPNSANAHFTEFIHLNEQFISMNGSEMARLKNYIKKKTGNNFWLIL